MNSRKLLFSVLAVALCYFFISLIEEQKKKQRELFFCHSRLHTNVCGSKYVQLSQDKDE